MWTKFWDMHSGGSSKENFDKIYIEAPEEEAKIIFYNRFGHNPDRVSCTCCGNDYSIDAEESLNQLTGFHRNLRSAGNGKDWRYLEPDEEIPDGWKVAKTYYGRKDQLTLEEYINTKDVLVIRKEEIKDEERIGTLPRQGYVWCD